MKHIYLILLTCWTITVQAQNLVPNPSFEDYNTCPTSAAQIGISPTYSSFPTVQGWVRPTQGSSDYFNSCNASAIGVPVNFVGYQNASSGNGYCGIVTYLSSDTGYAEYIECKLNQSMITGISYPISFYISLANNTSYASARIAAHFSDTEIYDGSHSGFLSLSEDIVSPFGTYFTDSANWVEIHGIYKAKGGEQWMTIGRFRDTAHAKFLYSIPGFNLSYYYIDDMRVVDTTEYDTLLCVATLPTTIHSISPVGKHVWNTADTGSSLTVTSEGKYWCMDSINNKLYIDTIVVKLIRKGVGDTMICVSKLPDTIHIRTTGPGKYKWNTGDTSVALRVFSTGKYWRRTIDSPCTDYTDTIIVNILISRGIKLTVCADSFPISITGTAVVANYKWNTRDSTQSITVVDTGTYWRHTWNNACIDLIDTIKVRKSMKGVDSTVCVSSLPVSISPLPIPNAQYLWNTADTTSSIVVNSEGIFWRHASDKQCVNYTDTFTVGIRQKIEMDTLICIASFPYTLQGNMNPKIDKYLWSNAEGNQSITITHTGKYWLYATGNCFDLVDSIRVQTQPTPEFYHDTTLCINSIALIGMQQSGIDKYLWNTGETNCCILPKQSGLYIVTLTNECGTLSDSINVILSDCSGTINVPTAFSPNGDGVNDILYVRGKNITSLHFVIFDRWGNKVFESNNINEGWDGTYKGSLQPVEIYAYIVRAGFLDGSSATKKGSVNLLR